MKLIYFNIAFSYEILLLVSAARKKNKKENVVSGGEIKKKT